MRHLSAAEVGIICNLELAVGVACAVVLLSEPLVPGQLVGGLLILVSACLAVAREAHPSDQLPPSGVGAAARRRRFVAARPPS